MWLPLQRCRARLRDVSERLERVDHVYCHEPLQSGCRLRGRIRIHLANRDSSLPEVPGFVEFRLLRSKTNEEEGYTLFSSHTIWASEADFSNWTKSESFRKSHRNAGDHKAVYKGHPVFEGFNVVDGI